MEQAYRPLSNFGCTYENQTTIFSQLNAHGIFLNINSLDLGGGNIWLLNQ